MVLSSNVLNLLSVQYSAETANAIFYASLQSWAEMRGLDGTAGYFRSQSEGERKHADKILDFIHDRNEQLQPTAVPVPTPAPKTFLDVFLSAQKRERDTTDQIFAIYAQAGLENDLFTCQWLLADSGLIAEQREEERVTQTILDRIKVRAGEVALETTDVVQAPDHGAIINDVDTWLKGLV